ncbi:MAG: hypothetical protein AAGF12_17370 [Myxococcota bacterium]
MRLPTVIVSILVLTACGSSREANPASDAAVDARPDGGTTPDAEADGGPSCVPTESYFEPGCADGTERLITAGCYQPCMGPNDRSCPMGTRCQATITNPCVCEPGAPCCDACGAETFLCLGGSYELASLDDPCDGTLTARDVLNLTQERYDLALTYGNNGGTVGATLELLYDAGRLVCTPAIPTPSGSMVPDQPAQVSIDVRIRFRSEDGSFAETVETTLIGGAASTGEISGGPTFNAEIPVDALEGNLDRALLGTPPATQVRLAGSLMGATAMGNVLADLIRPAPGPSEVRLVAAFETAN